MLNREELQGELEQQTDLDTQTIHTVNSRCSVPFSLLQSSKQPTVITVKNYKNYVSWVCFL